MCTDHRDQSNDKEHHESTYNWKIKQQISSTLNQIVSSRGHFNTWSNIPNLHPCLCDVKSFILLEPFPLQGHLWCHSFIFFFGVPFSSGPAVEAGERWHLLGLGTVLTWQCFSAPPSRYDCIYLHLQIWQCLFSIELEVAFKSIIIDHVPFSVCLYLFHQPLLCDHIPTEIPGFFTN